MAWGSNTNPVAIGAATRKVDYDDLWDKLQYVKDSVIPATTKMLFGQSSAPTGWTKDTGTWTDNSMIVFTTGSISSGGSDSPVSHSHSHSHYLNRGSVENDVGDLASISKVYGQSTTGSETLDIYRSSGSDADDQYPMQSGTNTDATTTSPLYQTVIAAAKDTYT